MRTTVTLEFETELKICGRTLNAPFAGKFQIDARSGVIDAIGCETWDGRRFGGAIEWLPAGQLYDWLHAIITDEYRDQIEEAQEERRLAGPATRADRQRDMAGCLIQIGAGVELDRLAVCEPYKFADV